MEAAASSLIPIPSSETVRRPVNSTPTTVLPMDTPISRKKLFVLVAVPSIRAGRAFWMIRTLSWRNMPTPSWRTKTPTPNHHTDAPAGTAPRTAMPAAASREPTTG